MPVLIAFCLALSVCAATRPRYGGTLRVQMRARVTSLDPRELPSDSADAAAAEWLVSLVFERLVRLDETGRPQPALAASWQHDASAKRWEFCIRSGVKFHDGTLVTPSEVAAALRTLLGSGREISVSGDALVIQSEQPMPDLPADLARGRGFVFRVASEGSLVGTGPFRVAQWPAGSSSRGCPECSPGSEGGAARAVFIASDDHWAGRPFLDSVEIEMGRAGREQVMALELGKADVVEIAPDQARRAAQGSARTWSSAPLEVLALVFDRNRPAVQDARVRQAIALSIDRAAIANVLLQKQGEAAASLLPHWLSGYAFLFSTAPGVNRARQLVAEASRAESPAISPRALAPLMMLYDSGDAVAQAVAERVAVNAREVGITMQVSVRTPMQGPSARDASAAATGDLRLARLHIASTDAGAALASLLASLDQPGTALPAASIASEQLYQAERALLETYQVVPLAHLPESYGLSARVKNWMAPRFHRGWRLEDVWLDASAQAVAGEKP